MMRRQLEQLKREIRRKERELQSLRASLHELLAETPPDKAAALATLKRIELLEMELGNDRASTSTLEDVIIENC